MLPEFDFIDVIKALIELAIDKFWATLALLFDAIRNLGAFGGGVTAALVAGLMVLAAYRYQKHLNESLADDPESDVSLWRSELRYSLPYLLYFIVTLPIRIAQAIGTAIQKVLSSLFGGDDESKNQEEETEEKSYLAATLGPSFFLSSVITAVIYAVTKLLEPLLVMQFDLTDGAPAWQYLILGGRPEMQWYIPLERFPFLGAVLAMVAWLSVWWFIARIIRIWHRKSLGSNLADAIDDSSVLNAWRTWFAATRLHTTDETYDKWAFWLPIVAIPSLIWGWLMIGGTPYRMPTSLFAVTVVLWLGWTLHLFLDGDARIIDEEPEQEPETPAPTLVTWRDVLDDLRTRLQVEEPLTFERPRKVRPLEAARRARQHGLISPLLSEIRAEEPGLTTMQQTLLETLSLQAFVHTTPPTNIDELELGSTSESTVRDRSKDRHRNQIVLAPEGAGKTTLAMLAAANHALMHTRSTLVVLRDEAAAEAFAQRLRSRIDPSTLRWTIRVSRAGSDLVNDLSQGITPDVLVCSLEQLTLQILDEPATYASFLENLGLVAVDDVESFCGPVEVHAQLAFRRLDARVREMTGVRQLGEENAPFVLALGDDSMHDTPTWVRTLCGMDAVVRYFDFDDERLEEADRQTPDEAPDAADAPADPNGTGEEAPEGQASDGEEGGEAEPTAPHAIEQAQPRVDVASLEGAPDGRYHVFYRLGDFVTESGESVSLDDLINACERCGVPWHYRPCGDQRRRHGRQHLNLRQEPEYYTDNPSTAGVVFLDGTAPTVKREMQRLNRAGLAFDARKHDDEETFDPREAVPVAFVAVTDTDEEMALTELNPNSTIAEVVDTLPRPVVRAPFGRVIDAHIAAELSDTWLEVDDVLSIFGNAASETLERLAREDMLLSERRTALTEDETDYEDLLYVRVPTRAVGDDDETSDRALLPPKVSQVELPSGERVAIRDHTNLNVIDVSDAHSARHIFYPGRIIERASGRYVVIGTAAEAGASERGGTVSESDIIVEPLMGDDISTPRRRTVVENLGGEFDGEPVFIGDYPMGVSLGAVRCTTTHMATLRLAPRTHDVRQRILFGREDESERRQTSLETVALGLHPNPDLDVIQRDDCPRLRLGDARLIAAAMRALLPAMYRGARGDIEVALHVDPARADVDYVLQPSDGFFLYDPHAGGNGAAAAIHRDGVDLLLRLCRVYLERVLYHDRLLARFDHWGDFDELLENRLRNARPSRKDVRERDKARRHRVLEWLDSRLRPEGSAMGRQDRARYGSGSERGEGDYFDLGRCWYSHDGSVSDLLWTKHRWITPDEEDAVVDVGIDRDTAATRRSYTRDSEEIEDILAAIKKQLENPAFRLDDQTIWGAPRGVWSLDVGDEIPLGSDSSLATNKPVQELHRLLNAVAVHSYEPLGPLARLLMERSGGGTGDQTARHRLVAYISRFVQGIPFQSAPSKKEVQGPLRTLLYRLGDQRSQTLLLALLLKHCGIEAGLMLRPEAGELRAAAATVPAIVADETTSFDDQEPSTQETVERLRTWLDESTERASSVVWGELPARPGSGLGTLELLTAIDTDHYAGLGQPSIPEPNKWVFLPLSAAWVRLGIDKTDEEQG
jgi:hypothetical protein